MLGLPLVLGAVPFRNVIAKHSQFTSLSTSFRSHTFFGLKHTLSSPLSSPAKGWHVVFSSCLKKGDSLVPVDLKEEGVKGEANTNNL